MEELQHQQFKDVVRHHARFRLRVSVSTNLQQVEFESLKLSALLRLLGSDDIQEHLIPLLSALRTACRKPLTFKQASSVMQLVSKLRATCTDADTLCLLLAVSKQVSTNTVGSLPAEALHTMADLVEDTHDRPAALVRRRALALLPFLFGHSMRSTAATAAAVTSTARAASGTDTTTQRKPAQGTVAIAAAPCTPVHTTAASSSSSAFDRMAVGGAADALVLRLQDQDPRVRGRSTRCFAPVPCAWPQPHATVLASPQDRAE